ncbi:MAG: RDD family protein [Raineya sp.]|jgi:uncharacterized RDD family membrane protein YckC|nr:RDD family protein [Raineya sp.]
MNKLRIETTQNVFIEFSLAGLGERILAFILDFIFIIVYTWALFVIAKHLSFNIFRGDNDSILFMIFFWLIPISVYSIIQEVFFNGQTLGKKILRIKVVTIRGRQPSLTQYMVRWLFRLIDVWGSMGIVGIVVAATNKYNQRVGDLASGTCLIKLKSRTELSRQLIIPDFHEMYSPKYTQVTLLSDSDVNLIKEAILTHRKYQNEEILKAFAKKTKEILRIETPDKDEKFLNRIVKDYTYLTSKED